MWQERLERAGGEREGPCCGQPIFPPPHPRVHFPSPPDPVLTRTAAITRPCRPVAWANGGGESRHGRCAISSQSRACQRAGVDRAAGHRVPAARVLALFAYWSFTLVAPFAIIAMWVGILAVALYPLFRALTALLGGRPRLAAAVITLIALAVIAGPLAAIAMSFAEAIQALLGKLATGILAVPAPPDSVRDWPLIGNWLHTAWAQAPGNLEATLQRLAPSLLQAGGTVLGKLAGIGVDLAAATIRNVARGVIGVALLQALPAGLAFSLFDVPVASVLAFAVLIFCIMQIGPAPILLPVAVWAWMAMETRAALGLTLILVLIRLIDNILKPLFVARRLRTPMLVILAGVIGGRLVRRRR
ncbi:hypothetical protein USDA257_c43760 [Sinorhizobium fredii USDA 257]|uniref:AI-2E family transporter n=1 Tax=Sinorhizobium fredii (strain USDA 257) TaxID=1185652 RepID=I3XAK8_SINF2|nr:hypothetical protein USDA257_c43760 [Sinorhizobium fredii USDA 257]